MILSANNNFFISQLFSMFDYFPVGILFKFFYSPFQQFDLCLLLLDCLYQHRCEPTIVNRFVTFRIGLYHFRKKFFYFLRRKSNLSIISESFVRKFFFVPVVIKSMKYKKIA